MRKTMNNALKLELQLLEWNLNWRRFDARISCISRWNLLNRENELVKETQKIAFKIFWITLNEPLQITLNYINPKNLDFSHWTARWTLKRRSWEHLENMVSGRSPTFKRGDCWNINEMFFKKIVGDSTQASIYHPTWGEGSSLDHRSSIHIKESLWNKNAFRKYW